MMRILLQARTRANKREFKIITSDFRVLTSDRIRCLYLVSLLLRFRSWRTGKRLWGTPN